MTHYIDIEFDKSKISVKNGIYSYDGISQDDPRRVDLSDLSNAYYDQPQAIERGAKYWAWMNAANEGGWSGEDVRDFKKSLIAELCEVCAKEHLEGALEDLCIHDVEEIEE